MLEIFSQFISDVSVAVGKENRADRNSRKYIRFNGDGTYEVEIWDLSRLSLVPHAELDNAFWIHYHGIKLGMLALETIGEATKHGYAIIYQWVAMPMNSTVEFTSTDATKACVDLMVNGVL